MPLGSGRKEDEMLLIPWLTVLIYLIFAGFGWLVFRVFIRRDYLQMGRLTTLSSVLETTVFFVHGVISYLYLESEFPYMPPLEPRPVVNVIAFVLMGGGLIGVLLSMSRLGYGATMGQASGSVRRTGIYAVTRNPQIIFYTILVLGYSLLWINWFTILWVLAYLFVVHMMVITEEEYLTKLYMEEYVEYCQEVPRYLFRVR
jgi:protein-S-isoprenylcysteine O-methyltransferase Ste14